MGPLKLKNAPRPQTTQSPRPAGRPSVSRQKAPGAPSTTRRQQVRDGFETSSRQGTQRAQGDTFAATSKPTQSTRPTLGSTTTATATRPPLPKELEPYKDAINSISDKVTKEVADKLAQNPKLDAKKLIRKAVRKEVREQVKPGGLLENVPPSLWKSINDHLVKDVSSRLGIMDDDWRRRK